LPNPQKKKTSKSLLKLALMKRTMPGMYSKVAAQKLHERYGDVTREANYV